MSQTSITSSQAIFLRESLKSYSQSTASRGKSYFKEGKVIEVEFRGNEIHGLVEGSYESNYRTYFRKNPGGWQSICSCPVSFHCKHAYALALAVLDTSTSNGGNTSSFEALALERLDRKVTVKERCYLRRIEEAWRRYRLTEHCAGYSVMNLLNNKDTSSHYGWNEQDMLREYGVETLDDPFDLLGYACALFEKKGTSVPKLAEELVDVDRYRSQFEARIRKQEVAEWVEQFDESSRDIITVMPVTVDKAIELALVVNGAKWEIHYKSDEHDYVRTDGEELRSWGDDSSVALSTQAIAFMEVGFEFFEAWKSRSTSPKTRKARAFAFRLLSHPELRSYVLDTEFEPLSISENSLYWKTRKKGGDDRSIAHLELVLPDGSPVPSYAVFLENEEFDQHGRLVYSASDRCYCLVGSTLYPSPRRLKNKVEVTLPWESLATAQGIAFLKSQQSPLPLELEENHEIIEPRLVLKFRTEELASSWGNKTQLCASLIAYDAASQELKVFKDYGWEDVLGSVLTQKGSKIQIIDPAKLIDFTPYAQRIRLGWDEYTNAWKRPFVDQNDYFDFANWLPTLPDDIEVLLSTDLAGLESPHVAIDYQVEVNESDRPDWFDVSLVKTVSDTRLTAKEMKMLLDAPGRFVRLPSGKWRRLENRLDPATQDVVKEFGLEDGEASQHFHALQLENSPAASRFSNDSQSKIEDRIHKIRTERKPVLPKLFKDLLRPYQKEGFQFLCLLSQMGCGGILADDMGLGKTVQALAWLVWLKRRRQSVNEGGFRVLVVCPKSVVSNWTQEPLKFETGLTSVAYDPKADGEGLQQLESAHILVVNYTQLRANVHYFQSRKWDAVLLDEAQYIKNPNSQTARAACSLNAAHRLILTGTPIENQALDLWSLMNFAMPGILGNQTMFKRQYNDRKDADALLRLSRRIKPFLLRRAKGQVAKELPPRIEEELLCELEGPQAKLYKAELKRAQQLLVEIKDKRQFDKNRFNILTSLLRLRQICCDPRLLEAKVPSNFVAAKTRALLDHLGPLLAEGHKILVFSQFVSMLDLLEVQLKAEGVRYLTLTGKTENRKELVDRFQEPDTEPVFLLSLKAAGSGLNLTAASYVVLFDPWWNPAVEAQAIDRTHRIGQVNQVIAYRLIAKSTIEEKIRNLQREKSALANAIVDEEKLSSVMTLKDIQFLLASS